MLNVCYIPEGHDYLFMKLVTKYLRGSDITIFFVAKTKEMFERCQKDGFVCYYIGEVYDQKNPISKSELSELDLTYGPPGIKEICNADKYLAYLHKDQSGREQLIGRTYKFWESFFETKQVDYVLSSSQFFFAPSVACAVAAKRGKPLTGVLHAGISSNSFVIFDESRDNFWRELSDRIKEGKKPLRKEQKKIVLDFIRDAFTSNNKLNQLIAGTRYEKYSMARMLREWFWLMRETFKAKNMADPMESAINKYASSKIKRRIWHKYISPSFFRYDTFVKGSAFVYFPIPFIEEVDNLATSHYWSKNTISLIEEISSSLPVGIALYVKEHPHVLGIIPVKDLRKMSRMPRVKILHPTCSGSSLIADSNCKAVVVVNGTSAWEAFLMQKPVVMLGCSNYLTRSNLIYKVRYISELSKQLFAAIRKGSAFYKENEEEWFWFIHSVVTTCRQGARCYTPYPFAVGGYTSEEIEQGAMKVSEYLAEKIREDVYDSY